MVETAFGVYLRASCAAVVSTCASGSVLHTGTLPLSSPSFFPLSLSLSLSFNHTHTRHSSMCVKGGRVCSGLLLGTRAGDDGGVS